MPTHSEIVDILKQLEDSACEEFHLRVEGLELSLRRRVQGKPANEYVSLRRDAVEKSASRAPALAPESVARTASQSRPTGRANAHAREVTAPMTGTFFRRPAPDEPPFVEVDDHVTEGDPLFMIEVMKLFSTIYAEFAGRVVSVEATDGESVDQGRTLILIEPD